MMKRWPSGLMTQILAARIGMKLSFHGEKAELLDLRIFNASLDPAAETRFYELLKQATE